ncbi:hypothetical protein ACCUM_2095 [Candidatus Accumulibacter phosphatis]|uniref:Uncharacterized protein n=1 Tax=Candidatus Accumulibacter phosphatis TaxID=327160 RepID=A0A5S4EI48_9PROT|nr:hypothetical protein ACCUM_2095 [Candidatus Accumulibacter phosphatis]
MTIRVSVDPDVVAQAGGGLDQPRVDGRIVLTRRQRDDLAQARRADVGIQGIVTDVLSGESHACRSDELYLIVKPRSQALEFVVTINTAILVRAGRCEQLVSTIKDAIAIEVSPKIDCHPINASVTIILNAIGVLVFPYIIAQTGRMNFRDDWLAGTSRIQNDTNILIIVWNKSIVTVGRQDDRINVSGTYRPLSHDICARGILGKPHQYPDCRLDLTVIKRRAGRVILIEHPIDEIQIFFGQDEATWQQVQLGTGIEGCCIGSSVGGDIEVWIETPAIQPTQPLVIRIAGQGQVQIARREVIAPLQSAFFPIAPERTNRDGRLGHGLISKI